MLTICESKNFTEWYAAVESAMQQQFDVTVDEFDLYTKHAQAKRCYEQGLTSHETAWELIYNAAE